MYELVGELTNSLFVVSVNCQFQLTKQFVLSAVSVILFFILDVFGASFSLLILPQHNGFGYAHIA